MRQQPHGRPATSAKFRPWSPLLLRDTRQRPRAARGRKLRGRNRPARRAGCGGGSLTSRTAAAAAGGEGPRAAVAAAWQVGG